MSSALSWLASWIIAGVISVPILVFVLKVVLKDAVHGFFQKQLEEYKAGLQAEHQRLVHESGLYAREKHRAYARVYRRMRIATDAYFATFGGLRMPQYEQFDLKRIKE